MPQKTALYAQHQAAGAKLVDFAGWDMPLHYGSQLEEHHLVRQDAGVFDVSHMVVVDVQGVDAKGFLRHLLANDVDRLKDSGKALYSCMLKPDGGVIDDLIVYYLSDTDYRVVVNAGTRDKDLAWMNQQAHSYSVELTERADLAMLAVQGPNARDKARAALGDVLDPAMQLKPFYARQCGDFFVARTGYTGEDGFEIMLPNADAPAAWQALLAAGVTPAGLGARDTLRLEAGMNLYGQDMDETTSPLESGLTWTLAFDPAGRDFIGRQALERQRSAGVSHKLVGLILDGRGVLRHGQKVLAADGGQGVITSGGFAPTLNVSIALARVPLSMADTCLVEIRNKQHPARVVKPPFVRFGKSCL